MFCFPCDPSLCEYFNEDVWYTTDTTDATNMTSAFEIPPSNDSSSIVHSSGQEHFKC